MTKLKRNIRSSQGLPEAMGFSMLPHSHSAIAISNRLTGSQFRLWHYLMMIDPFADQTRNGEKIYHPIPSPAEIAVAIGASQRTVEKDMKRLEELGLYAKRITQWEGYNTTAEAGKAAATKLKNKSICPEPLQDKGGYLTADPAKQPDIALNNRVQPPEPLQHKYPSIPHTIHTYSDFINTLSDSERESFVKFGEQKAKQLPRPPELPQRWIEKNWEELSAQWHKESGKTSKAQTEKWENHPQRQEWIEKIRHLGPLGFQAETNDRDEQKQRRDFAKWATDNKLIWGMES